MNCDYCHSPRYLSDQYCPNCGKQHQEKMRILQCVDVDREVSKLNEDLPSAEIFTGVVIDMLRYERVRRSKEEVTEIGMWWLTLDNGDEQRQLSIYSEDEVHDKINRGDVLTVFRSSNWTHNFRVKSDNLKPTITNDDLAEGVVTHGENSQVSTASPYSYFEPKEGIGVLPGSFVFAAFLIGICWAVAHYFDFLLPWQVWAGIAGVLGSYFSFQAYKADSARYENDLAFYHKEKKYFERIKVITRAQLNAVKIKRPQSNENGICKQCQTRKNKQHAHCTRCGAADYVKPQKQISSTPLDNTIKRTEIGLEVEAQNTADTVQSFYENHVAPKLVVEQQDYVHEFGIGSAKKGSLQGEWVLGTVSVRELESNVKKWVEREYKTTTYTNGYGKTRTESHLISETKHRRSDLNGFIVLSMPDGSEFSYVPTKNQLSHTNVGDVVLIGTSQVDLGKEKKSFQQSYHNVSKDLYWDNECVSNYVRNGITGGLSLWLLIAAGGMAILQLPILMVGLPIVLSIILWGRGYEAQKSNKAQRVQFVEQMKAAKSALLNEKDKWIGLLGN